MLPQSNYTLGSPVQGYIGGICGQWVSKENCIVVRLLGTRSGIHPPANCSNRFEATQSY
jgi:hypothetical protein